MKTRLFARFLIAILSLAGIRLNAQERALTKVGVRQLAKLTASDGASNDTLGYSVSISGNTVAVGAPDRTVEGNLAAGAVYVFVKPANGWGNMTQVAELTASDGGFLDNLGHSVAINGNTIVAGAPGKNSAQGATYVFVEPSGGWANMSETAELVASDGKASDGLGTSVSISGNEVVAGAPSAAIGSNSYQGAAYTFVKPSTGWISMTQSAKLTASDGAANDSFGSSVSVSGATAVAGAPFRTNSEGALYVFVRPLTGWRGDLTQTAELTTSDMPSGELGASVSINGDTIAAGAPLALIGSYGAGAVYVYVEPGSGWVSGTETAKLTASDLSYNVTAVGASVAVAPSAILAGAPGVTIDYGDQGVFYIFAKPPGGWMSGTEVAELKVTDPEQAAQFGYSVSLSGSTMVGGEPFDTIGSNPNQGAAYVFGP